MTDLDEQAIEAAAKANCPDAQTWEAQSESRIVDAGVIVAAYLAARGSEDGLLAELVESLKAGVAEMSQHYHGGDAERVEHLDSWLDEHGVLIEKMVAHGSSTPEQPRATVDCPACDGEGLVNEGADRAHCAECNGQGVVARSVLPVVVALGNLVEALGGVRIRGDDEDVRAVDDARDAATALLVETGSVSTPEQSDAQEAAVQMLFAAWYPGLEWVEGGGRHVAEQAECRRAVRHLVRKGPVVEQVSARPKDMLCPHRGGRSLLAPHPTLGNFCGTCGYARDAHIHRSEWERVNGVSAPAEPTELREQLKVLEIDVDTLLFGLTAMPARSGSMNVSSLRPIVENLKLILPTIRAALSESPVAAERGLSALDALRAITATYEDRFLPHDADVEDLFVRGLIASHRDITGEGVCSLTRQGEDQIRSLLASASPVPVAEAPPESDLLRRVHCIDAGGHFWPADRSPTEDDPPVCTRCGYNPGWVRSPEPDTSAEATGDDDA